MEKVSQPFESLAFHSTVSVGRQNTSDVQTLFDGKKNEFLSTFLKETQKKSSKNTKVFVFGGLTQSKQALNTLRVMTFCDKNKEWLVEYPDLQGQVPCP